MTRRPREAVVVAALVGVLGGACATNPVTGKKQVSMMSEAEELTIGKEQDAEVRREMGVYDDAALQRYVDSVGQKLASGSHRPNLPWSFTVVDSQAVNAFALPGGYVYITRGILPYLDDESELAGVLGHEIGHVTARHAAQQYTRQAQSAIGLTVLGLFVPGTRPFTDLGASALSVVFLKYGRDAELEADRLGIEYGSRGGWDPSGVPRFLSTLARVDAMSARGVPNWLSTHPDPGSRVKVATPLAAQAASPSATATNRDAYLDRLAGTVFGDSPKDGIVRANVFLHPILRIGLEFPEGWEVTNAAEQVMAREPGTDHYMVLQQVDQPRGRSLGDVATSAMTGAGYTAVSGSDARINGLDAHVGIYRGSMNAVGQVTMRAVHIRVGRDVYAVAGLTPAAQFARIDPQLDASCRSFHELSREEASRVTPNRIDFYTTKAGDSWQSIAVRAGRSLVNAATLAIMNDHEVSDQPRPGERIKIVVEGSL